MRFYLGTHKPTWLKRTAVPLFLSRRRLIEFKKMPRALGPWALDSGGFTEISKYGWWKTDIPTYIEQVYRFRDEVGNMDWAACQDWMCEPQMLEKTGRSVLQHQLWTTYNYLELCQRAPEIPWVPVLQGWAWGDHVRHAEIYAAHGVDLARPPCVGIGSVCRRQDEIRGALLVLEIADELPGIKLHGFGFKKTGLTGLKQLPVDYPLYSSDSMAWSFAATKQPPMPGHTHKHCGNCMEWAMTWRRDLLGKLEETHAV